MKTGLAVSYAVTADYLFEATVSAQQLRKRSHVPIFMVLIPGSGRQHERAAAKFAPFLGKLGVDLVVSRADHRDGMPVSCSRYFLDRDIPDSVESVLYLDADTQFMGAGLDGLRDVRVATLAAARDPMVLLSSLGGRTARRVDRWWTAAGMPANQRHRYVNSGVLVFKRRTMADLHPRLKSAFRRNPGSPFGDQDWLNVALEGEGTLLSMAYNFPGFLLGTAAHDVVNPSILHFMSRPKPANGARFPWTDAFCEPYRHLAVSRPELSEFSPWGSTGLRARYAVQQRLKRVVAQPTLRSAKFRRVLRDLEGDVF